MSSTSETLDIESLPTIHAQVGATERIAPNLLQLTITGLGGSPYDGLTGGDVFAYVMISHEPGGISPTYGMDDYRAQAPDDPVRGAYYTIRRSRPEVGEIDVWVVVHDHPGTVSAWMSAAAPGDPLALWGPRHGYRIPDDVAHLLLVADESGLAAAAALIETLPGDRRATAVLECVDAAHRPPMPDHPGLTVVWVDRGTDDPGAENRLLDAVTTEVARSIADGAPVPDAAFGAAESRQISAVRRHVRSAFGVPAARVLMTGYWRRQES
jgi:NADPH-dependent ferric siderophore reductase